MKQGRKAEDGAAKAFGARHTAGRAALAHLELALKLAGGGTGDEDAARRVSDSIAEWRARMSTTPTAGSAAAKRSGRWVIAAPTSNPPLLPPEIASFLLDVYL